MKYFIVSLISIVATLAILYYLKDKKSKSPETELKDKAVLVTRTPQFKILMKDQQFRNLLKTPEFADLSLTFGRDFILSQLGL